jgi:hypothetical protein
MDVWYVRGYAMGDRRSMHDDDVFYLFLQQQKLGAKLHIP